jgi:tetratricopeptide (TPR) repeat protein
MDVNQSTSAFFVAGGTLRLDVPSYVKRPTDDELFELVLDSEFCYVLTPRQMGKSSLMVRIARRLQERGVKPAIIDLTRIGTDVSAEEWYLGMLNQLKRQLRLRANVANWWQERATLGNVQRFVDFMRDVILAEIGERVVILIDEIDTTLRLEFRDDFFAAIRAMYNARAGDDEFQRLTFVLLGVASPPDLIHDTARTPFNIGHGLVLQEFSRDDAHVLQDGLEAAYPGQGETILSRIFYWTNGHPYLTQRLCLAAAGSSDGRWTDQRVDALVESLFLSEEARKETNLQFAQNLILSHPDRSRLLALYSRIVDGKRVQDDVQSPIQSQLKLSGIVKAQNGVLHIRNEIYGHVFGRTWIQANTPTNWTRRIAVISTVLLVITAVVLGIWWSRRPQQAAEAQAQAARQSFLDVPSPDVRITNLANLFQLGYEELALSLFYDTLAPEEQTELFEQASPAVGAQLVTVVQGLYTYYVLEDDEQANALLDATSRSLRRLDDPTANLLAAEIGQWRTGRDLHAQGQYEQAIFAYNAAIDIDPNEQNLGTVFDRALAYAASDDSDRALSDLEALLSVDSRWNEHVQSQVTSDTRLYSALWRDRASYSRLIALVPAPTPTYTATHTPRPTQAPRRPTAAPTATPNLPTATQTSLVPRSTPTSTSTPETPTSTSVPTSTPTDMPTSPRRINLWRDEIPIAASSQELGHLPNLAYGSEQDRYLVVFQSIEGIDGQMISADGTAWEGRKSISDRGSKQSRGLATITYNTNRDEFLVVWQDYGGIFGQLVSSSGERLKQLDISSHRADNSSCFSDVVYDPENHRYFIVWSGKRGDITTTYGRLFDEEGNPVSPDFALADSDRPQQAPAVACGNKHYLVVWQDLRVHNDRSEDTKVSCGRDDRSIFRMAIYGVIGQIS